MKTDDLIIEQMKIPEGICPETLYLNEKAEHQATLEYTTHMIESQFAEHIADVERLHTEAMNEFWKGLIFGIAFGVVGVLIICRAGWLQS